MKLKKIKIISFDLDGTLVKKDFVDYFWLELIPELYSIKNKIELKKAKEYIFNEYDKIGKEDIRWYLPNYWLNYFNLEVDSRELLKKISNRIEYYQDALNFLEIASKKYTLIISSNAAKEFIEIELEMLNKKYFKHVFSCVSDFNIPRKNIEFYKLICEKLNVKPFEMIHIGDDEEVDYQIPIQIGINAFYFHALSLYRSSFEILFTTINISISLAKVALPSIIDPNMYILDSGYIDKTKSFIFLPTSLYFLICSAYSLLVSIYKSNFLNINFKHFFDKF
jgi:putative hydrolase of the HAD superfamily